MNNNIEKAKNIATKRVQSHGAFGEIETYSEVDLEKFATQIVKECVAVMRANAKDAADNFTYMGDDVPTAVLCSCIENHFGIE